MKIFNNQPDVSEYFRHAILDKENELEAIFGYSAANNPMDKKMFIKLLNKFREVYISHPEETLLDIRTEFKKNVSAYHEISEDAFLESRNQ